MFIMCFRAMFSRSRVYNGAVIIKLPILSWINIAIGDDTPEKVFEALRLQVSGGKVRFGGITNRKMLEENLAENCIPVAMLNGRVIGFDDFLVERRKLMAQRIKTWFESLGL